LVLYYNNLGNTGIKVSQIGLGTEYLFHQPKRIVIEVIQEAIEAGINYYDALFSVKHYLENLGDAFKGYREKIIIAGHMGTKEVDGKARKTRDVKESKDSFIKLLSTLKMKSLFILIIYLS
jgi:aryl-alcohol dehydrogenase-like predicted oxidoreductase